MNAPSVELTLTAEQRRYLNGPIVLHNANWADTLPDWLRQIVPLARAAQVTAEVAEEVEPGLATLEEVCAYLYTASLAFPLQRDYAEVYVCVTAQVLVRHGRAASVEAVFAALGEVGTRYQTPTQYQEREVLHVLQRDIRRSVARHSAGRRCVHSRVASDDGSTQLDVGGRQCRAQ